jgi:hypothetical protein
LALFSSLKMEVVFSTETSVTYTKRYHIPEDKILFMKSANNEPLFWTKRMSGKYLDVTGMSRMGDRGHYMSRNVVIHTANVVLLINNMKYYILSGRQLLIP